MPEPELEHRDIPADRTDPELALAEQRTPSSPEGAPRRATDKPRRTNPVLALECEQSLRRQPAAHAVDWTGVEPVSPKPDLDELGAMLGSPQPETVALMEKHGVVQPITLYVES